MTSRKPIKGTVKKYEGILAKIFPVLENISEEELEKDIEDMRK